VSETSLYELGGGRVGIHRLATAFYARVFEDAILSPFFRDPGEPHAERLALWLTELLGGPAEHTEARGGYAVMIGAHRGLRIPEEARARWAELMRAACDDAGMPQAFTERFRPFIDGGSTLAMRKSF
jgi:hemoglobin